MSTPQTINGLMRHLRNDCNIKISGSYQKQQLVSYGYYHGYKGYRFIRNNSNQIPYTDFSEIVAVIEYDNNMKAALYSDLMFIETAIKNIVCDESVNRLKIATFDYVYKERMCDNAANTKLQSKRLWLRNSVYSKLSTRFHDEEGKDNQMLRHFYNRGEDVPLWVVFEILYLSDLASFFECLNESMREYIMVQLDIFDNSIDTNRNLLSSMLYTIKSLRNAVAHNSIIFDTRLNLFQNKIPLAFFARMLYIISNERGVCFQTALGESLCGSLFCYRETYPCHPVSEPRIFTEIIFAFAIQSVKLCAKYLSFHLID